MSRLLLLGNFHFEHELADPRGSRQTPSKSTQRMIDELTPCLIPLARPGDAILTDLSFPSEFLERMVAAGLPEVACRRSSETGLSNLTGQPWGWSLAAQQRLARTGCRIVSPDLIAIATGNSRAFSTAVEQELSAALPGASILSSTSELPAIVADAARIWRREPVDLKWVIKAEFGMSGRERLASCGQQLTEPQRRWISTRTPGTNRVYFEPWVESLGEISTQWDLPRNEQLQPWNGTPELIGITQLLSDRFGQYLGNQPQSLATLEETLHRLCPGALDRILAAGESVARRLMSRGVAGPLGIDAMIYRAPDGRPAVRPVQDINVRFTMGRVACELHRRLNPEGSTAWLHTSRSQIERMHHASQLSEWLQQSGLAGFDSAARWLLTAPDHLAGQPVLRQSLLVMQP